MLKQNDEYTRILDEAALKVGREAARLREKQTLTELVNINPQWGHEIRQWIDSQAYQGDSREWYHAELHKLLRGKKWKKETNQMRTTMGTGALQEGIERLINAGYRNFRVRPRSWSNDFFAIEIDVTEEQQVTSFERAMGRWNPIKKQYEAALPRVNVTHKLISLDYIDAFIRDHRMNPIVLNAEFVGNNSFRFMLPDGKVLPGPRHADRWTLAEVRAAGGETSIGNQTYILNEPVNLFRKGSK